MCDCTTPTGRASAYPTRVGEIVAEAAKATNEKMLARGLPPLPHVTPHTLRRTYISIALLANNFDVKWVMSQVGHADSKMTMDVYAQLEQRAKRDHGASFDRLVRQARTLHDDAPAGDAPRDELVMKRHWGSKSPDLGADERVREAQKSDRGRDARRQAPPAQIPACGTTALGSSLGFWR